MPRDQVPGKFGLTVGTVSPVHFPDTGQFYMADSVFQETFVDISPRHPDAGNPFLADNDSCQLLLAERCQVILTSDRDVL